MPDVTDAAVELLEVERQYRPPGEPPVPVLRAVSLRLRPGESVAVVGPSGCGKSTLLNLVGGLDRPDGGTVRVNGRDLAGLNDGELAELRNRELGFVFQLHHLLPQCTVLENVLVPTLARRDRAAPGLWRERAQELLARVGLQDRAQAFPGTLSGGERQRVAVARALINQPRLLLADEPTGALDAESAANLAELLLSLKREMGTTLLVVTHSRELARQMERALLLRGGSLSPFVTDAP